MNYHLKTKGLIAVCAGVLFLGAINLEGANQMLTGHVPAVVNSLQPTGVLPATNQLRLAIALPLRNEAALSKLLHDIYDPASANFHHYLKPEEFAARFGPSTEDYEVLKAFALKNGLSVSTTHPNRVLLDVTGSAADVQRAFHVTLRTYQHPTENRIFFAPDTEPSLDLSVPILHISGLSDYGLPRPRISSMKPIVAGNASGNSGSGPAGAYMGNDFRAAYVPDTTLTGAGQIVGLLQFDGYSPSDITYYESKAGLPNVPLQNVLIDGATGSPMGSGAVEVCLDIEDSISMAPGLAEVILYIAPNPAPFVDILNRMATDNLAKQLSCSWYVPNGPAEPAADVIFQQMAAQGQSFYSASGDSDAYTGLIPFPGDTPYITEVGGTTLTTSGPGGSYVSEKVWNWGNGVGSSGGISTQYSIPAYQTNISMTANQGSTTMRNTPDVALTADNVYVRAFGSDYNVGGTSCAAPLWAGFTALVNQEAVASGRSTVGFINQAVDAIGTGVSYTMSFHDITTGNNQRSGSGTEFSAVAGYDLCTGWGTPAGQHLIDALGNPESLLIRPLTGFSSAGGVGGPFTSTSEILTLTNSGTNALTWTIANVPDWLDVSTNGGTLNPGGPATALVVSLNSVASNLDVGDYSATIWITNLNDNFGQSRDFTLSIVAPPSITSEPVDQAVLERSPAQFSVTATGGLPLSYQWQFNGANLVDGTNISGSTTATLNIQMVSGANAGTYDVVITNVAGTITSSNAALTITPSAPVILQPPTNQSVYLGMNVSFSAYVVGTTPYSYQWSLAGTNIPGATSSLLLLTNVQFDQAGDYTLTVTNALGGTSADATLTVNPPPPCLPPPAGIVGWWPGEDNSDDIVGTNNAVLSGGADYAQGLVGQAFDFPTMGAQVTATTGGLPTGTSDRTIEAWVYFDTLLTNAEAPIAVYGSPGSYGEVYDLYVDQNGYFAFSQWGSSLKGPQVSAGQWYHVAVTSQGTTNINLYLDGTNVATGSLSFSTPSNSTLLIGSVNLPDLTRQTIGQIDELSIYSRALTSNEIAAIYNAGSEGKCSSPVGPYIFSQSTNQNVPVASPVTLFVISGGTPPLSYQWMLGGQNIAGATNSSLFFASAQVTNSGVYSVQVASPYGDALSTNITLNVYATPPTITSEPTNQSASVASTVSLTVGAAGSPPLFYQWTFDGTNMANGTNSTLILSNVQTNQSGVYAVGVSNAFGSVTSSNATLTVYGIPPSISQQPTNASVPVASSFVFNVGAAGSPPLFFQWTFKGTNIANATNSVLSLSNLQTNQSGTYAVIVSNAFGSISSSNATLTVYGIPPAISQQPVNTTVDVTGSTSLTVGATGSPPLFYQWAFDGTNIAGATNTSLVLTNVQLNQGGSYQVTVTNAFGSTNSSIATLTVSPLEPCDPVPSGIVGWWQAEDNPNDIAGTNNAALLGGATYTNGMVGQAFDFPAVGAQVTATTGGLPTGTSDRTIEAWVYFNSFIANAEAPIAVYGTPGNAGQIYDLYVNQNQYLSFSQWGGLLQGPTVYPGQWYHVAVTSQGTNNIKLYLDGTNVATGSLSFNTPSNTTLYIGRVVASGLTRQTLGKIDELSIYNRALSSNEIQAIYAAGNGGKCQGPPAIVTQPVGTNVPVGTSATFSVSANGSLPLAYQWTFSGTNIPGATRTSLTLTNIQSLQAGIYAVMVTNIAGSVTSSNAILTVTIPPYITNQPLSQTNYVSTTTVFTVAAGGGAPYWYQWKFNGTNISAATTSTLTLSNTLFSQGGNYSVMVTNLAGSVLSSNALLTVIPQFHFVWNTISSPKFVNLPFTVTIYAENSTNGIATNFTGKVSLLSTNGIAVSPTTSAAFNRGFWVGHVTIGQVVSNLVLEATDSYGEYGLANTINVVNRPQLTTGVSGGNLQLFWPVNPSGFILQSNYNLKTGTWTTLTAPPIQVGNQYLESVPLGQSNAFYRLIYTGQ